MILSCILAVRYNHTLSFSVFTSRMTSLLACNRAFMFFIMVFVFSLNIIISIDQDDKLEEIAEYAVMILF